jgi:alkylation response protein AidB-like acyl-CoA dehydrogenase
MGITLSRVRELASAIVRRAEEIECQRRLPADLIDELIATGCCRMCAPATHGGATTELMEILEVIETLARADGATGWLVSQHCLAQLVLTYFPAALFDTLFADGPDVLAAGALAPKGRATRRDGAWQVTGQWPFVSGCEQAAWIYLQCMVVEDRQIQFMSNGMPVVRLMLFPARQLEILDTWRTTGLRGTGSHDVRVAHQSCLEEFSCTLIGARSSAAGRLFAIPLADQGSLFIAAVAVGIAQGALDDIVTLAIGKRPAFSSSRLAESPMFQDQLGDAHMNLRAARALLYRQAEIAWAGADTGTPQSPIERSALRATAPEVVWMAARTIDIAYTLAGGSSVYESSALQRRWRDIHAATQHAWNGRDNIRSLGALLAGAPVDESLF